MNFLICICTYNRNQSLYNCLKSFEKIILFNNLKISFLILDNSINNKSFILINKIKKNYKYKILQINEKKRGIVNARNRCLKEAKKINCDYIAFFDDDCTIDKYWFKNAFKLIDGQEAQILTGPQIYEKVNKISSNNLNNLGEIFEKKINKKISNVNWAASNNVLIKKKIIEDEKIFFDINLNKFGMGEDQLFFSILKKRGYNIFWSKDLKVYEKMHEHRTNLKWMINRSFRLGVLGHYIDIKLNGSLRGYFINYLKFIYYFLKSIFGFLLISKKYYWVEFLNSISRSFGRLVGPFIFKKIKFYKK